MISLAKIKDLIRPTLRDIKRNYCTHSKVSFSQCGEDLILQYLFSTLGIATVTYLDIGAHHPAYLNNTYFFYRRGGRGVCVEPDPSLYHEFIKMRPHDQTLSCGVGVCAGEAEFFVMSERTLNTFSRAEAERYQSYGTQRITKVLNVELRTINDILKANFSTRPNLVSLDVEGMDYAILQTVDFKTYRPEVFCIETLTYTENKTERKLNEIIRLMHANGYWSYADTYINTIFVDAVAWENRP